MNFFKYSSIEVKVIYIISLIIVFLYMIIKFRKRKYVLSIFNYSIYINFISYYITSIFQYNDIAWKALGKSDVSEFYYFLNKNLKINLTGVCIFFIFLTFYEFKDNNMIKTNIIEDFITKKTNIPMLKTINIVLIGLWFLLVFYYLGFSLPILRDRGFLKFSLLQSIYNILNGYISTLTIMLLLFVRKNNITKLLVIINFIILLGTGNRGPLLSIFLTWFIYYMRNKKITLKTILKYVIVIFFIFVGVIYIEKIRSGGTEKILFKIKYGNTFSDIRDGAFILYGMEKLKISFLYGKMYLADFLAFIPSEFIKYRENYGYSNFTTRYLFGWQGHYGLRGGMFITPYINFGYIGILIVSYMSARMMALVENYYYKKISYKNYYYVILLNSISNSMLLTAGFMEVYIILGQIFILLILSILIKGRGRDE